MGTDGSTDAGNGLLLGALPLEARETLLAAGIRRHFAKGAVIFAAGDRGDSLYVIESGRVEISLTSAAGRRSVLNHMGRGEVLGEIAMLDGGPRSAEARAATDVALLCLSRPEVMRFFKQHPETVMALIGELCAKVRNASEMFDVQAEKYADARLARCLLRLGEKWGRAEADGSIFMPAGFTQHDLGEFAGLARENVNRHLKAWAGKGVVELVGGEIVVRDLDALRDIADED